MGLLNMAGSSIRYLVLLMMICAGCSHLQLRGSFHSGENDWKMYGGDIGRGNLALDVLPPPLKLIWEYDAGAGFGSSGAAIADSVLFIGNLQGEVHAVDITTGKGRGVHDFGSAIVGTPVVDQDLLYVALAHDEESLVAYDLAQANVVWRQKLGDIETSPLLLDQHLYVAALNGRLFCVEKTKGEIVWKFDVPSGRRQPLIHSSPATDGKTVVFGCDDGNLYAVDILNGKLRWKSATAAGIVASPSIHAGRVFIGSLDGSFYAFDLETGSVAWKRSAGAKIFAAQAVDEEHVYVGTAGRRMLCLNAATGAIVWEYATNGVINAAPTVSGEIVYVVCIDRTLFALDARRGELLWQYKAEGRIKTMPQVWKNHLFVFAEDRSVLAFSPGDGK